MNLYYEILVLGLTYCYILVSFFFDISSKASSGAGAQVCDRLWIRIALKDMKYLFKCIFSFLCSGVEK